MKFRLQIVIFCMISYSMAMNSQNNEIDYYNADFIRNHDFIYDTLIKTTRIYKKGWELSLPIINLNTDEKLVFMFDDLRDFVQSFYYEIKHCDANWGFSDLPFYDYAEGFEINPLTNYQYSFNTLNKYIHYELEIPNNEISLKKSGNYLLMVYDNYSKDHLLIVKRFYIVEQLVSIDALVHQARIIDYLPTSQEIDFSINLGDVSVNDPYSEVTTIISQNGRYDNAITSLKPLFIKDNLLIYDYDRENLFDGNVEFRNFSTKSIRYKNENVAEITYQNNANHVILYTDERKAFKRYFFDQDLNGKYTVEIQEADSPSVEADYVWVQFSLAYEAPLINGNLYVFGQLFDWGFTSTNRMKYDYESKSYQLSVLLKQGFYNYTYAFLEDSKHAGDISYIEGSHYEAENDYIIYVYVKDLFDNYDKLAGYQVVNSLIKQ